MQEDTIVLPYTPPDLARPSLEEIEIAVPPIIIPVALAILVALGGALAICLAYGRSVLNVDIRGWYAVVTCQ